MKMLDHAMALQGKEYVEGWQDCYTLVQDFYQASLGLKLTSYARPHLWHLHPEYNFFETQFNDEGFISVGENPLNVTVGDAIFFNLGRSEISNHIAIYVGGNKILHHIEGRKSIVEDYGNKWRLRVTKVIRHPLTERFLVSQASNEIQHIPYPMRHRLNGGDNVKS